MLTPEQIEARRYKMTSSNIAAALGLDPYTTPLQAALKARGETEHLPAVDEAAVERGNEMEALLLDWDARQTGLTHAPAPYVEIGGWAGDSADGLLIDDDGQEVYLQEAKTAAAGVAAQYGDEGTDEVPTPCLIQAQWHLIFRPHVKVCRVPVIKGGYRFAFDCHAVARDKDMQGLLWDAAREYWERYVDPRNPRRTLPAAAAGDTGYLANRWPQHRKDSLIVGDDSLRDLARAAHEARVKRQDAEIYEKTAKNALRAALADAEGVRGDWGKATYRAGKPRRSTDWQAIAEELGGGAVPQELIDTHTTERQGPRVLRVTPVQGVWT